MHICIQGRRGGEAGEGEGGGERGRMHGMEDKGMEKGVLMCAPFSYWKIKNGITIAGRKVYTVRKVLADFAV